MANDPQFLIGQLLRIRTSFKNEAGVLFNPNEVKFQIRTPGKAYSDPETIPHLTGIFDCHVHATEGGTWWYRVVGLDSEGNEIAADEGPFEVARSRFPSP